ncbi:hypothetical protein F8C76_10230 [Flagellimonas olearia]|uniref:Uncharacterized protein n=1 Tax=Flagellimonas olearia TaxID=552546 RepID=A0A6I1DVF6_9FLAO|nr:hypothetical protein [Allomuricauda olearia]KAB7528239.1 hypothetical protein F8C76_10230 [Allomuricauda olearia]
MKHRYIKVYEMKENFNNVEGLGNYRSLSLEEDSDSDGVKIIEHNTFTIGDKVYVSCLIELE